MMMIWRDVEDALEAIIEDYERVNHVISLYQDDRARIRGLEKASRHVGVSLELGPGPGNFTQMLRSYVDGFLVCLDYSDRMLPIARSRNREGDVSFVRGVFEALPLRKDTISYATMAYALRDSTDKARALEEIGMVLRPGGDLLVVDIGKPDNPIVRGFFSLYMRYIVPILGGLATGYGYRNPWSILHKTYELLPVNRDLRGMMERILGTAQLEELAFGGLIIVIAVKRPEGSATP